MITTHVLDTSRGRPAAGVTVILELRHASDWTPIARGVTDANGRLSLPMEGRALAVGTYRLIFDTGSYERDHGVATPFFPEVTVTFNVRDPSEHHHVPLLLSTYGYSTYRGS